MNVYFTMQNLATYDMFYSSLAYVLTIFGKDLMKCGMERNIKLALIDRLMCAR